MDFKVATAMPTEGSSDFDLRLTPSPPHPVSLLDRLLHEQQELTAVDRFARFHDENGVPDQARYYSAVMPATTPGAGEQYAFEVDLDACSGCKACVTACHSLNGLDDDETWRDVGLLHGGTAALPVLQHVTTACHHCLEPACLQACPVDAFEKHPVTGIVSHLDDQCFGCQYCILACPYDVPKYNKSKGIVRKCDMCSSRLAVGEAPACVQACPHQAISIKVVSRQQVIDDCETNLFLPGAPEPRLTLPTTTYKTQRVLPRNMLPADYFSVQSQHAHWPLVLMLVLTQLSVGAFLVETVLQAFVGAELWSSIQPVHCGSALCFGWLALGTSLLHLGRPLYAFRAVIGLRHSWLSREIVAFGGFAMLSSAYAVAAWMTPAAGEFPVLMTNALGGAVVVTGLAGVVCSVMIYHRTRRVFWNGAATGLKFLLTTLILGIASVWLTLMFVSVCSESPEADLIVSRYGSVLCQCVIGASALKLAFEASLFRHLWAKQHTPLKRSATLMTGELANATLARFCAGFVGGVWMPGFLLLGDSLASGSDTSDVFLTVVVASLFAASLVGEILERYLFFSAVVAPKMPGALSA